MRLPLLYLAALFALAFSGYTYFFHFTEQVSYSGFSAIETMLHTLKPENFAQDFPSGNVSGARHSILTRLYAPIHELTGLSGLAILRLMIGLEIACVIGAGWVLWNSFIRTYPSREFHLGLFCWLATMLVAGYVVRPNLSNFGYPYFSGQFYGFADATSMLAVAALLRGRWLLVAAALCLGFMIHPTKTLMAAAFIGGAALAGGRDTVTLKSVLAGVVTAVFAGAWAHFWLGIGQGSAIPPIPADQYLAYTRGWQYHWYPFDRELFTKSQYTSISPFLGMQLFGLLALAKSDLAPLPRRQWIGGMATLAILTLVGLWFSYSATSVFLVKMALLRASELMTLLTLFVSMCAIYNQWQKRHWGWVAFFTGFLLGAMLKLAAVSAVVAALAVGVYLMTERKQRPLFAGPARVADCVLAGFGAIVLVFTLDLGLEYPEAGSVWTPIINSLPFVLVLWLVLRPRVVDKAAKIFSCGRAWAAWGIISASFLLTAGYYLYDHYVLDDERLAQARDFHAVQLWANANTPTDALFMVDPCHAYGWREFSERSSIGSSYEWFHTGWLYVSDNRVFERGQAIRKTLGLDFEDRLPKPGARAEFINTKVCEMAQARFYDPSLAPQRGMASEHGVDYFVMESGPSEPLVAANRLTPVFANSHYRVLVAKDLLK